jgi:hypothetical protein
MLRQRDSSRELISGSAADELFSGVRHSDPGPKLKPLKLLGFGGAERVLCSDVCNCKGWNKTQVTSEEVGITLSISTVCSYYCSKLRHNIIVQSFTYSTKITVAYLKQIRF